MSENPPGGIQTLIGDALREGSNLAQKEIALFRTEMASNVRTLGLSVGMMVAAAAFLVAAIILLTQSLVKWLATIVQSEALAALIVAVLALVVAGGLALWGRSTLSASTLVPSRTGRQVRQDARVLSERISG